MNKKLLIIVAAVSLISFGATFFVGMKTNKAPEVSEVPSHPIIETNQVKLNLSEPKVPVPTELTKIDNKNKNAMTEKQLRDLIYEVREKINEYDFRLQELELREKNLQTAKDTLRRDINDLDNLRIELTSTVSAIKTEQEKLQRSLVEINIIEETNLKSIAATYDKMDAAQAGKILSNMNETNKSSNADDAVKILYFMSERTKAKVLAAIAETEPAVSANFCQRLKKISVKGK